MIFSLACATVGARRVVRGARPLATMSEAASIDSIRAAESRIRDHVVRTPLLSSPFLDELVGRRVLVKAECLQRTGSFKIRGAWSAVSAIPDAERAGGVIAYSSGNHGQGVACAAEAFGIPAVIVMPEDTPSLKIANTKAYGAEVVLYDRETESREEIGGRIAAERGMTLVKPFDDPQVISGQGTVGLEIAEQAAAAGVADADVLVCCGGGGLSSGIALALEATAPGLRVRTCEPERFDDTARSLASGQRERNAAAGGSICDAIVTPTPGELTFPVLRRLAGAGLVVSEREALDAMRHAFLRLKVVAEPGGAVALAAALHRTADLAAGDAVICVISGGNCDPAMFERALSAVC